MDGFFDQARERTSGHPLVAPATQGGLTSFTQTSGHVTRAPGDQAEQDGLEAVPVGDTGSMTAQRVGGFDPFRQVAGKRLPDGVDDGRMECKHGTSTGSLGWDAAGSCPVRHNDRWTFFLVMGGPPPTDPRR